jgi:hypothetical protein
MAEQPSPIPSSVQANLHAIAEVLRDPHPLDAESRKALAALMDELGAALANPTVPAAEIHHLTESTAQLVQAVHRRAEPGLLASARNRLEAAVLRVEGRAPLMAGLAQRLLDALANIGI